MKSSCSIYTGGYNSSRETIAKSHILTATILFTIDKNRARIDTHSYSTLVILELLTSLFPLYLLYVYNNSYMHIYPREKATEILFETLTTPAVHMALQPVLALYSCGPSSGLIVDIGESGTQVKRPRDFLFVRLPPFRPKHPTEIVETPLHFACRSFLSPLLRVLLIAWNIHNCMQYYCLHVIPGTI